MYWCALFGVCCYLLNVCATLSVVDYAHACVVESLMFVVGRALFAVVVVCCMLLFGVCNALRRFVVIIC